MLPLILSFCLQEAHLTSGTTPEGIALRWLLVKQNYPAGGFHVYRRGEGESEFTAITKDPIRKLSRDELLKQVGQELAGLVDKLMTDLPDPASRDGETRDLMLGLLCDMYVEAAKAAGVYYHDTAATRGKKYAYQIRAGGKLLASCAEIEAGGEVKVAVPAKPETVIVENQVLVTWEKLPKLNAYHVYRCEVGGKWERLTAKALPVFDRPPKQDKATPIDGRGNWLDKTVKVGGTYQYAITAIDLFGRESQKSDPSPLEVKDVIAPGIPSGLVVEVKDGKMTATWKAPTDVDVVGYHIYRAPTMEDKFEKLNKELVKETQFVDSVTEGGYVYTVSSVDKQGNESSQTVPIWGQFIDQVPPAKITGLAVKAEGGKVTLTWDKAPDKDLDRYVVSRWIGGDWVIVTQGLTETRFEEEVGVHFKEALKYRVHSVDTSHNNGEFAEAESKMPDTLPPAVPSLRQVVPEEKGLKLSWDALDEDAAAFFIERAEAQEGPWTRLAQVKEREYSDATVEAGRTYWYTVIAVDAAGNASGRSNAFSGELADRKPPAKPAGLSGKVDKTMVRLSWTANAEADLDGYVVERKSGDDWEQLGGLRKKAEYVDGSVRIGKYGYRVTAYDKSGNRSDTSDTIEIEVQE